MTVGQADATLVADKGRARRSRQATSRWDPGLLLGTALISLGSGAIALVHLGRAPFWRDEAWSFSVADRSLWGVMRVLVRRELNMGVYYLLAHVWLIFGKSEVWLRSLSVLFSVLAVFVTALAVNRVLGRRAALITATLLATNPFVIRYAREARAYSLVLLLVACSSYCFARAWGPGENRWHIAHAACLILLAYTHFLAVLVTVGFVTALLAGRHWSRRWANAYGATGAAVVPLAAYAVLNDRGQSSWIEKPNVETVRSFMHALVGGDVWLVACGALAAFGIVVALRRGAPRERNITLGAFAAFTVPVVGLFAVSYVRPLFVDRYLIFVVPALILLLAYGILRAPGGVAVAGLLTGVMAAHFIRTSQPVLTAPTRIEDLRSAAAFVADQDRHNDALLFEPSWARVGFEYYAAKSHVSARDVALDPGGRPTQVGDVLARERSPEEIETQLNGVGRVWVVGYSGNDWSIAPEPAAAVRAGHVAGRDWVEVARKRYGQFRVTLYDVERLPPGP